MPSEVACRMSRIDHHYEVEPLNATQPRGHSINLSLPPCSSCCCPAAAVIFSCHRLSSESVPKPTCIALHPAKPSRVLRHSSELNCSETMTTGAAVWVVS